MYAIAVFSSQKLQKNKAQKKLTKNEM